MTSVSSTTTPSGITLTEYKFTPSKYVIRIKEIKLHKTDPISVTPSFDKDNGTRIYYDENYSEHNIATPIELSRNNITKPTGAFNYASILIRKDITMNVTAQFGDGSTYYSPYLTTNNNFASPPAWIEIPDTSGPAKDVTINMKYLGSSNLYPYQYYSSGNIKAVRLDKDKVVATSSSDVSDIFIRFKNPGGPFLITDKLRFNFNISEITKLASDKWDKWILDRSEGRPYFKTDFFKLSVSGSV